MVGGGGEEEPHLEDSDSEPCLLVTEAAPVPAGRAASGPLGGGAGWRRGRMEEGAGLSKFGTDETPVFRAHRIYGAARGDPTDNNVGLRV